MKSDMASQMKNNLGGLTKKVDSLFTKTAHEPVKAEEVVLKSGATIENNPPAKKVEFVQEIKQLTTTTQEMAREKVFKNVTVPMTVEMKNYIDDLWTKIDRNGLPKHREKGQQVTTNTIIRTFLSFLEDIDLDVSEVSNEDSLKMAMEKAIKEASWKK